MAGEGYGGYGGGGFDPSFFDFMNEPALASYGTGASAMPSYGSAMPSGAMQPAMPSLALPETQMAAQPAQGGQSITWAQFLKYLQGISGPYPQHSGGMAGWQQPGQAQSNIYQIGPTADFNRPSQQKQTSVSDIMAIAGMFGA